MTYSAGYLQGLKDGRAAFRDAKAFGLDIEREAKLELQFCYRVSRCMGSAKSADYIAGLRDFWNHQLKRLGQ